MKNVGRWRPGWARLGWLPIALGAAGVVMALAARNQPAEAIAPCIAHANTGDELTFIAGLQAWRDTHIAGSYPLTVSAPLNAAAAGYAQFLADTPGAGGHYADGTPGFAWATRAIQCGYPANQAAGGEGLAVVSSSATVSVSPQQALATMTAEGGGGVWVPSSVGLPVKCVGAAKATSADGKKVAWVTLVFAASGNCPSAGTAPPTVPGTSTATATATRTASATPSPTPSPTPTPRADGATVTVYEGWNLVTLPGGKVQDVLGRAEGCFRAIYQQQGDRWLRYSPQAPAYANNLNTLNGGTFWIEGTAANCGLIHL